MSKTPPKITDPINNLLCVEMMIDHPTVTATCSFQSIFIGSAYCKVYYGKSPHTWIYSATSQQMGSAGKSVTVEFELDRNIFDTGSDMYFKALADESECVGVTGSVEITKSNE